MQRLAEIDLAAWEFPGAALVAGLWSSLGQEKLARRIGPIAPTPTPTKSTPATSCPMLCPPGSLDVMWQSDKGNAKWQAATGWQRLLTIPDPILSARIELCIHPALRLNVFSPR